MTPPYFLIVEDTPQTLLLIEEVVKFVRPGAVTKSVRDPREALVELEGELPLLIITDMRMPGMNGYEFIEHLYQDERTRDIPVILMTAFANSADDIPIRRKLRDLGIEKRIPIIPKPFSIASLRGALDDLLNSDDVADGATTGDAPTEPVASDDDKTTDSKTTDKDTVEDDKEVTTASTAPDSEPKTPDA